MLQLYLPSCPSWPSLRVLCEPSDFAVKGFTKDTKKFLDCNYAKYQDTAFN